MTSCVQSCDQKPQEEKKGQKEGEQGRIKLDPKDQQNQRTCRLSCKLEIVVSCSRLR